MSLMYNNYKIIVNDSNYQAWDIYKTTNYEKVENIQLDPIEDKLFSNDVFSIENNKATVIHSSVRSSGSMPGVIVLHDNKTYGKYVKYTKSVNNNKSTKYLYKCIPDDSRLPHFLVPYEIKKMGFSKNIQNMYITFNFSSWNDKHPIGIIDHVIGNVDVLDNYYEYQLYCKSLNASIQKFQKYAYKMLKDKPHESFIEQIQEKYNNIEDRTDNELWNVFTIDPNMCQDFDDAMSIQQLPEDVYCISIYISNVAIWLDVLNLWESFSQRIATIYLPDKKRPMMPTILSDCLCSLQEDVVRIAFTMDIFVKNGEIINIKYKNTFIKVSKNYVYEEKSLLKNPNYKLLIQICNKMSSKYKYINTIRNSHDLVCYLMILMNYHCAKEMIILKKGIFRSTIMKRDINIPKFVPDDVSKFITIWKSATGQYINVKDIHENEEDIIHHDLLKMDAYVHITSPIRRIVDLLNLIILQKEKCNIVLSDSSSQFYDNWCDKLEYINTTMRSIRKIQCDCSLLALCSKDDNMYDEEFDGYLFDKIERNDGLYQYNIFLPKIKLTSRITMRDNVTEFVVQKVKIFLFHDEEKIKKKIRIHIV